MGPGRKDAFQDFFSSNVDSLQRFAAFMCGDIDLAADLTQEAFVRAYKRWRLIRKDEAPAYLRRTVVNLVRDRQRKAALGAKHGPLVALQQEQSARTGQVDDWLYISQSLKTLSPVRRAAVVLRYYDDMSEAEIASILDRPLGTVKSDLHRALKDLRELIAAEEVVGEMKG